MGWSGVWSGGVDAIKLYEPYSLLDEVVDSINERNDANSRPNITMDDKLDTPRAIMNEIQIEISALILLFLNHTNNGGDWDGEANIPKWTVADILTAIGAGSRLAPNKLYVDAEWLIQQYKILNLLRWTSKLVEADISTTRQKGGGGSNVVFATALAQASSNYDSAGWVPSGGSIKSYTDSYLSGGNYIVLVVQNRATMEYEGASILFQKSVDWYFYGFTNTDVPGSSIYTYGNYATNLDSTENRFKRVRTDVENALATDTYAFEQSKPTTAIEPVDAVHKVSEAMAQKTSDPQNAPALAVFKWDGANGFTFKDW